MTWLPCSTAPLTDQVRAAIAAASDAFGYFPYVARLSGLEHVKLHASDNRGQYDGHLPPGQGTIDWPRILALPRESGFRGTIIIGEGERDEAPMLYIGESVGCGKEPEVDIAVDPLEGTNSVAYGRWNAMSVIAMAPKGDLLNAPDTYMDKIATGPEAAAVIDLTLSVEENIERVALAKNMPVADVTAVILDRDRHQDLMKRVRRAGARIHLITDGDVPAAIATAVPNSGIDLLLGIGGAPEGVLAAAALRCVGGQFKGRLLFRNDDERLRARKWGIEDLDKIYDLEELAKGDCIFAATGVTDGSLLDGVKILRDGRITTETVVMRASSGTVRRVKSTHGLGRKRY